MYSKVKFLGHAVHPMFVSFPITFYFITFLSFAAYEGNGDMFWFRVGYYANIAGVTTAIIAALPGLVDWGIGIPEGSEAKTRGFIHGILNVIALVLFSWNIIRMRDMTFMPPADVTFSLVVTGLGLFATMIAGYHGFSLVSVNKVGVELTPEQERIEPVHPTSLTRPKKQGKGDVGRSA